jgi:hypothetical protein
MPHSGELQVQPLGENWQAAVYQNSWVDFGGTATGAAYFKDSHGVVHLRGLVKNGVIGQAIFTLPAGFRPPFDMNFPAVSAGAFGVLGITPAGLVVPSIGNNAWFSLDGFTFRTT